VIAALLLSLPAPQADWLIDASAYRARVTRAEDGRRIEIGNGLVRREWRIGAACATVSLRRGADGALELQPHEFVRALEPEARLVIAGRAWDVGGLAGQIDRAFLLADWVEALQPPADAFVLEDVEVLPVEARMAWKQVRPSEGRAWPPPGAGLDFVYRAPAGGPDCRVHVRYELYDGLPVFAKWIEIENGAAPLTLDRFEAERLAVVEEESAVEELARMEPSRLHVETDMAFGGMHAQTANPCVVWGLDPAYETQVSYEKKTRCQLVVAPPLGPGLVLAPGERFRSFTVFELLHDSTERERRGLAQRRMYRVLAPWVTENPLMMHIRDARPEAVRLALDQCAEVGFEMAILSFGSGFNPENRDPKYREELRGLAAHAKSKGVELGGYSLLSSRSIGPETDVIDALTGKPGGAVFGNAPCLMSRWGLDYFEILREFYATSGFSLLEHDGSYPGDDCASTAHVGHRGHADSQWKQYALISSFYRECRANGVYLNVPDYYYLAGANKCAMGYRETNWSLPRELQVLHARQNIYDGTWTKAPSMGWMFVPLTEYHGGGAAATLEPLSEHLVDYEAHLAANLGAGVQACFRGPRLYDSEPTRALVERWVDWYKAHRAILESDIVHLSRPTGRDVDVVLHVNPALDERALAMVHNPLPEEVERELVLPLYYAGLRGACRVALEGATAQRHDLDGASRLHVRVRVPARARTWLVVTAESR